jgi:hypothetical protein
MAKRSGKSKRKNETATKAAADRGERSKLQTGSLKVHGDPLDPAKKSPAKK